MGSRRHPCDSHLLEGGPESNPTGNVSFRAICPMSMGKRAESHLFSRRVIVEYRRSKVMSVAYSLCALGYTHKAHQTPVFGQMEALWNKLAGKKTQRGVIVTYKYDLRSRFLNSGSFRQAFPQPVYLPTLKAANSRPILPITQG